MHQHAEVLHPELPRLQHGQRRGRSRCFKADSKKHDLPGRLLRCQLHGIDRGIDRPDIGSRRASQEQTAVSSRHAQHVAEAGENHIRALRKFHGVIDRLGGRHTHGAARPMHQFQHIFESLFQSMPQQTVCLAAADIHDDPPPRDAAPQFGELALQQRGMTVLVDELHLEPTCPPRPTLSVETNAGGERVRVRGLRLRAFRGHPTRPESPAIVQPPRGR